MGEIRLHQLDDEAEIACAALAEAMFPHIMDHDKKMRAYQCLRAFLLVAFRGPIQ